MRQGLFVKTQFEKSLENFEMTPPTGQELPLAGHSSPTEDTEFSGQPVEGYALSLLLSVFDPPLPTDVQKPLLVGLGGFKESGKDATAAHWAESGFFRLGMSWPLVEIGRRQNPWIRLDRTLVEDLQEYPGKMFHGAGTYVPLNTITEILGYDGSKEIPEVRKYYQTLGTEVGRKLIGEDVWVEIAREKINSIRDAGQAVAITGIRFANELEMIKRLGGHTVWVDRPGTGGDGHESETSLSKEDFDFVLANDRDLEQLHRRADHLLTLLG